MRGELYFQFKIQSLRLREKKFFLMFNMVWTFFVDDDLNLNIDNLNINKNELLTVETETNQAKFMRKNSMLTKHRRNIATRVSLRIEYSVSK